MLSWIILWCILSIISACRPWTHHDQVSNKCVCGDKLRGVVHCGDHLAILYCNCITYSKSNQITVGKCMQMCRQGSHSCSLYTRIETINVTMLNDEVCGPFNRTGQLCGDCIDGCGSPVYSYSMVCAECKESMFKYNLLKYWAVAFLSTTWLYLACMMLNIPISSGIMVSYVLISQIYTIPDVMEAVISPSTDSTLGIKILISFYSVWNMDIFRAVYTPFCLHPSLSTMHTIALDYLIALYPALLMLLTYLTVSLYDNYKHIILHFYNATGREWNLRGSLINTFATFFVLSYVKIMTTSFKLLSPAYVYTMNGNRSLYLFNAGEVPYFSREHLPFGILAIVMVMFCNVLPVVLLLVYPTTFFQSKISNQTLTTFMDAFQGCYRHHPRDCRYFSAVYFIFRAAVLLQLLLTKDSLFLALAGLSFIILTSLVIIVKPYKRSYVNYAEIFLYMVSALFYLSMFMSYYYVRLIKPKLSDYKPILVIPVNLLFFIITSYGILLITYMVAPKELTKFLVSYFFKLKSWILHKIHKITSFL